MKEKTTVRTTGVRMAGESSMRKKRKKSAKTTFRNQLRNWSRAVRDRDSNKCFLCGSTEHLQAHHILPKHGWKKYCLELDNGITLCAKCHSFGKWSVHNGAALYFYLKLMVQRPVQFAALKNIVLKERGILK